jgi:hypothetical protein
MALLVLKCRKEAKPNQTKRQAVAESQLNSTTITAVITALAATTTRFRLYFLQYGHEFGHIS